MTFHLKYINFLKQLCKPLSLLAKHWLVVITLLIAIVGGVPGFIATYDHFTDRPKIVMNLLRIDFGSLKWPEKQMPHSYVLLEFEVTNEEATTVPLPHEPFYLFVKVPVEWVGFEKMPIPLSGTVLYRSTTDQSGANIDHMDLQKFRELNIGRLYGNFKPTLRKRADYLNSNHYLLFLSRTVELKDLEETFENINSKNLPVLIKWQDTRGKKHEPYLVCHVLPTVTTGCYKVHASNVKYYEK